MRVAESVFCPEMNLDLHLWGSLEEQFLFDMSYINALNTDSNFA